MSNNKRRLFVFLTIILSILILELVLRVWGSLYLSLYFSPAKAKAYPQGINILCLGDSYTYGFGAPKGSSYPEQLASILNISGRGKNKFNVYREFRINSSSLLKYLDRDIKTYNPGLIIVMTGCNDRWSLQDCDYPELHESRLKRLDIRLSHFNTYKLIKVCLLNLISQCRRLISLTHPQPPAMALDNKPVTNPLKFHNQSARMHYSAGESYFWGGENGLAIKEYKAAEQLEPTNPWLHFRLACVYIQALGEHDLGKKHAFLALSYGDSSMVEYVFMLMQYCEHKYDTQTVVDSMKGIIQDRYKGEDKIMALSYLNTLCAYRKYVRNVENIISYNLKEIVGIARQKRVKLILMQYPFLAPWNREAISKVGRFSCAPVVDNYALFEKGIKKDPSLAEKLFVNDGHCSAAGYGVIAYNLYRSMIRYKIINDSSEDANPAS